MGWVTDVNMLMIDLCHFVPSNSHLCESLLGSRCLSGVLQLNDPSEHWHALIDSTNALDTLCCMQILF